MLKQEHLDYFQKTLRKIKYSINTNIPITPYDHDMVKGHKNALGIFYADGNMKPIKITIDEYFIEECYEADVNQKCYLNISLNVTTLTHVICHEIAHTRFLRHGKKHNEFTSYLEGLVEVGKPHGALNITID